MATKRVKKGRQIMEYEDAPSGGVMLYNYKEPFMPFEEGYGFQGVLLFDADSDEAQCHLCGEWIANLPHHLHKEHTTTASEYKEKVGLSQTSALIGEKLRAKLIASGLEQRLKNLKKWKGVKRSAATRKKISEGLKRVNRERQNLTGTCPAQLIERIRTKYHDLGRTPNAEEIGNRETYRKVFGTYKIACEMAGVPYNKPGHAYSHRQPKIVESEMILWVRDNVKDGKLPKRVEYSKYAGLVYGSVVTAVKRYGGWENICRKALLQDGTYRKVRGFRYTKEELLDFLRNFKKINGREAAISDCKRGLLPNASRYIYYWKSWHKALKEAYGN